MQTITRITNTPRDYAWGARGRISQFLGRPATDEPEAELWLGSHPASPSLAAEPASAGWRDLADWEQHSGEKLPFLLKVLAAAAPLSLQAHPSTAQARAGYQREDNLRIPLDDPRRNYKDPNAKPELIVAVEDGFEALCGFREPTAILADLAALATSGVGPGVVPLQRLLTGSDPLRSALTWALSGSSEAGSLADALTVLATGDPGRWALLAGIAEAHPGDPGLIVSLTMNHVMLRTGEALWLPPGRIHAYLRGIGIELMGPSDNVLRGGLTPKTVDVAELTRILDFVPSPDVRLAAEQITPDAVTYRPASLPSGAGIPFQLLKVTGDVAFDLAGRAIAVSATGSQLLKLEAATLPLERGQAAFLSAGGRLSITGSGILYLAVGNDSIPRVAPGPRRS